MLRTVVAAVVWLLVVGTVASAASKSTRFWQAKPLQSRRALEEDGGIVPLVLPAMQAVQFLTTTVLQNGVPQTSTETTPVSTVFLDVAFQISSEALHTAALASTLNGTSPVDTYQLALVQLQEKQQLESLTTPEDPLLYAADLTLAASNALAAELNNTAATELQSGLLTIALTAFSFDNILSAASYATQSNIVQQAQQQGATYCNREAPALSNYLCMQYYMGMLMLVRMFSAGVLTVTGTASNSYCLARLIDGQLGSFDYNNADSESNLLLIDSTLTYIAGYDVNRPSKQFHSGPVPNGCLVTKSFTSDPQCYNNCIKAYTGFAAPRPYWILIFLGVGVILLILTGLHATNVCLKRRRARRRARERVNAAPDAPSLHVEFDEEAPASTHVWSVIVQPDGKPTLGIVSESDSKFGDDGADPGKGYGKKQVDASKQIDDAPYEGLLLVVPARAHLAGRSEVRPPVSPVSSANQQQEAQQQQQQTQQPPSSATSTASFNAQSSAYGYSAYL
eukprot:jgi/Chlat1/5354/Chrsp35S05209